MALYVVVVEPLSAIVCRFDPPAFFVPKVNLRLLRWLPNVTFRYTAQNERNISLRFLKGHFKYPSSTPQVPLTAPHSSSQAP